MKLQTPSNWSSSTIALCTKHGYNYDEYDFAVAWYDDNNKLLGYALANQTKHTYILDWIWARPGYGTPLLKAVERRLFKERPRIELLVSIDSRERKQTVLRRMNFYIKNRYKLKNVRYDPKGVMFTMFKLK